MKARIALAFAAVLLWTSARADSPAYLLTPQERDLFRRFEDSTLSRILRATCSANASGRETGGMRKIVLDGSAGF